MRSVGPQREGDVGGERRRWKRAMIAIMNDVVIYRCWVGGSLRGWFGAEKQSNPFTFYIVIVEAYAAGSKIDHGAPGIKPIYRSLRKIYSSQCACNYDFLRSNT